MVILCQVQHMRCILPRTKPSSKALEVTKERNIIHLQPVCDTTICLHDMTFNAGSATSGACATIASDALMNPFDGIFAHWIRLEATLINNSNQTKNAGLQIFTFIRTTVCTIGIS